MLHDLVTIQAKGPGEEEELGEGGKERGYPVEADKNPTDLRALPLPL